ncbi:MAG: MotA/TolQ/ExbB proton channel family protein [Bacteroidota bacterium]|jgi:biopolymer transport protein ExbB
MKKESLFKDLRSAFSGIVIPVALVISIVIFTFIMGNGANFQGGNHDNSPLPNNYLGIIYKGGFIVPILMTLLLTVITISIERFLAIRSASGRGSVTSFVRTVKGHLSTNQIEKAVEECNRQKGSVANVVLSSLTKYSNVEKDETMNKEQKILSIQKDIEEATSLELPSLEQNLVVLATISSVATLMGLLGTVIGMIKAFSALANAGAPDSVALATGISEALINTAFGIGTAALAIIFYNLYTTKIDKLTYSIDEAGFSIVQTFASNH